MRTFQDYCASRGLFQEFGDLNAMDTSHVDLQYINGIYLYDFNVNGVNYRLTMDHMVKDVLELEPKPDHWADDDDLPFRGRAPRPVAPPSRLSGYDISFTASGGRFSPTNDQGAKAGDVYTQVMLGIKKFLEEVESNVMRPAKYLSFYGFERKQDLIYDRLVRRFLTGYTRVSPQVLVRNDVLEQLKRLHGPEVDQIVQRGQEDHRQLLAQTRDEERRKKTQPGALQTQ